jgi:hypothetical protein
MRRAPASTARFSAYFSIKASCVGARAPLEKTNGYAKRATNLLIGDTPEQLKPDLRESR